MCSGSCPPDPTGPRCDPAADAQILPALLQAAVIGVARTGFPAPLEEDLCARIAAATINTAGPLGEVDNLVGALRAALRDANQPVPDILPAIVHHLMPAFERATASRGKPDIPLAAANVQALFARCLPEDQSTVRRAILVPRYGGPRRPRLPEDTSGATAAACRQGWAKPSER